jgi:hypothetical protein
MNDDTNAIRREKYRSNSLRETKLARRREEYRRNATAYIRRAKAYKKTPDGRRADRNWRLKKLYGISGEQWDQLFAEQRGLCAICRMEPIRHTDHCHETGAIRGLLCRQCNIGLGMFLENMDLLERAIAYLARNAQQPPKVRSGAT